MHSPEIRAGEKGKGLTELDILIQGYSSYLVSLGKSALTAEAYARDVRTWAKWFKRGVEHFHEDEWDDFVMYLTSSGKKGSTIKRCLIGLRRFFKYLRRRKIVSHDPSRDSEPVKVEKPLPSWLSEAEAVSVLNQASTVKHRAILEVLYSCGLRNAELRSLQVSQVSCDGLLTVTGKGRKQRIVPIPGASKAALDAWLLERPKDTELLFPNIYGRQMRPKTLRKIVRRLVKAAGITKRVTPHTLRHSIATHLAMRGVTVERIQLFLGHESPETTMTYIHLANSIVQEAVLKAHPRA